jgi:pimeloyl-ACP methyl ester carboxylesterase
MLQPLLPLLRLPGAVRAVLAPFRFHRARALVMNAAAKRGVEREAEESYGLPPIVSGGVRRDVKKVLAGLHKRYTLEAAERLSGFDRPVLIAWSREDKFFPTQHAERLAKLFPDARLEWIEDAYTFSPEDQPRRLAELIASFVREPAPAGSAAEPH